MAQARDAGTGRRIDFEATVAPTVGRALVTVVLYHA